MNYQLLDSKSVDDLVGGDMRTLWESKRGLVCVVHRFSDTTIKVRVLDIFGRLPIVDRADFDTARALGWPTGEIERLVYDALQNCEQIRARGEPCS